MQNYADKLNATLSDDARFRFRQAQAEAAAISGALGVQAQILALAEVYAGLRAAGKLDEAAALKARVNAIVEAQR